MCGWTSSLMAFASRWNRSTNSISVAYCSRRTFRATIAPSAIRRAVYTVAIPPSLIRSRISYCCAMTCPLTITVPVAPSPLCFVKTSLAPVAVRDGATARLWNCGPSRTRGGASGALQLPTRRVDLHAALQSDRGGNAPSAQFSDEGLDPLSTRAPVLQPIDGIPGDEVHMERIPESPARYLTL